MLFGYIINRARSGAAQQRGIGSAIPSILWLGAILPMLMLAACGRSDAAASEDALNAQALLEQRRIAEARIAINKAITARDDDPELHLLRGRIEYAANSPSSAFDAYSNAMALDPSNMEALQAVSQLGLQTGNLRESLEATDAILSLAPDDANALLARGLHSIVRSRYDEANSYADRILAKNPNNEGGIILKARVAARRGQSREALAILDSRSAHLPATVALALTRLEVYRVLRDPAGMRSQFALLRSLAPDNHELRIDEANLAFKEGQSALALTLTADLLALPDLPPPLVERITGLWSDYESFGPSDRAINAIAESGSAAARAGVAEYLADQRRARAARVLTEGLRGSIRAPVEAYIAASEGNWILAGSAADRILASDKTDCLALIVQSEFRLRQSKAKDALRSAQLAANQCPTQISAWRLSAESYTLQGDLENARRMWRQGVEANPQNALLAGAFVAWLRERGQQREALAVARRLTYNAPALLSGWRLYRSTCIAVGDPCAAKAALGLTDASTILGIDLLPGEAPPNALIGRIQAR